MINNKGIIAFGIGAIIGILFIPDVEILGTIRHYTNPRESPYEQFMIKTIVGGFPCYIFYKFVDWILEKIKGKK